MFKYVAILNYSVNYVFLKIEEVRNLKYQGEYNFKKQNQAKTHATQKVLYHINKRKVKH